MPLTSTKTILPGDEEDRIKPPPPPPPTASAGTPLPTLAKPQPTNALPSVPAPDDYQISGGDGGFRMWQPPSGETATTGGLQPLPEEQKTPTLPAVPPPSAPTPGAMPTATGVSGTAAPLPSVPPPSAATGTGSTPPPSAVPLDVQANTQTAEQPVADPNAWLGARPTAETNSNAANLPYDQQRWDAMQEWASKNPSQYNQYIYGANGFSITGDPNNPGGIDRLLSDLYKQTGGDREKMLQGFKDAYAYNASVPSHFGYSGTPSSQKGNNLFSYNPAQAALELDRFLGTQGKGIQYETAKPTTTFYDPQGNPVEKPAEMGPDYQLPEGTGPASADTMNWLYDQPNFQWDMSRTAGGFTPLAGGGSTGGERLSAEQLQARADAATLPNVPAPGTGVPVKTDIGYTGEPPTHTGTKSAEPEAQKELPDAVNQWRTQGGTVTGGSQGTTTGTGGATGAGTGVLPSVPAPAMPDSGKYGFDALKSQTEQYKNDLVRELDARMASRGTLGSSIETGELGQIGGRVLTAYQQGLANLAAQERGFGLQQSAQQLQKYGIDKEDSYRYAALSSNMSMQDKALAMEKYGIDKSDALRWAQLSADSGYRDKVLELQRQGMTFDQANRAAEMAYTYGYDPQGLGSQFTNNVVGAGGSNYLNYNLNNAGAQGDTANSLAQILSMIDPAQIPAVLKALGIGG